MSGRDVDQIFDSPAEGGAWPERCGVGVAGNLSATRGDEIGISFASDTLDAGGDLAGIGGVNWKVAVPETTWGR